MRTNTTSESPNAVTWGVFPHCEIIQPTIVESISFLAWKDEAYQLGKEGAKIYPAESKSRKVINETLESFFLVNVVHNDYRAKDAIFEPFFAVGTNGASAKSLSNGSSGKRSEAVVSVKEVVNGVKENLLGSHQNGPITAAH